MAFLESVLAVVSGASGVAGLHGWVTGLATGARLEELAKAIERTQQQLTRLSDKILFAPSVEEVRSVRGASQRPDAATVSKILEHVQGHLDRRVLATAVISSPPKLRHAFQANPWSALLEVRPLARAVGQSNPDLVPVLFWDANAPFVGWQMRGVLPVLFDCAFEPAAVQLQPGAAPSVIDSSLAEALATLDGPSARKLLLSQIQSLSRVIEQKQGTGHRHWRVGHSLNTFRQLLLSLTPEAQRAFVAYLITPVDVEYPEKGTSGVYTVDPLEAARLFDQLVAFLQNET